MEKREQGGYQQAIIAIAGPTASGKTDLALKLAKRWPGFVISADSRQIYQDITVGTGQPVGQRRMVKGKWQNLFGKRKILFVQGIPHLFIGERSPAKPYNLAQYQQAVFKILQRWQRWQVAHPRTPLIPYLVGGTGLYLNAVVKGYQLPSSQPNKTLRKSLEKQDAAALFRLLQWKDPTTAKRIDRHNKRRLIRALEHALTTEESFSAPRRRTGDLLGRPCRILYIILDPPPAILQRRIAKRVRWMFKHGLLRETERLWRRYGKHGMQTLPATSLPALSGIGYAEAAAHLRGDLPLADAIARTTTRTRQYAKRQRTWFRRNRDAVWVQDQRQAIRAVREFLTSH